MLHDKYFCLTVWFENMFPHILSSQQLSILKGKVFFVLWPDLKMFCTVFYQSQVHSKYFLFDGQAWKHYSMEIIGYNNIYFLHKHHTLEWKYFLIHSLAWKHFPVYLIRQTSLTVRLKNTILCGLSVTSIIQLK